MKILSIDGSKAVHAFLDRSLSSTRYQLIHAMSGKEGIEILKSNKEIQLILLDWEMPEKTGPDVLKAIRALGVSTPVIMLTSKNSVDDIQAMIGAGAQEYVMKPFTPEILIEKIESILGVIAA